MFVGQRAQRFGKQMQLGCAHGQLAVVGFEQRAFHADDVAQIPMFEGVVHVFAHALIVHIHLNLAAYVLHGGEAGLAHGALQHHAAGDFDGDFLRVELGFFQRTVLRLHIACEGIALILVGEGNAVFAQFV